MVEYRSVSQVREYNECPHRYYLHRRLKAWERPAAWLVQGLSVHEPLEAYEKSDRTMTLDEAQDACVDSYVKHTARLCETTPNWNYWFASGPYKGAADVERRLGLALDQVERYFKYVERYPELRPDVLADQLAVELPFEVTFGDVEVRGFIDQVVDGKPIDIKTGNKPGDEFQLATYAGALKKLYGIEPNNGAYWMARTGKLTMPYDLTDWTEDRLAEVFGEADEGIRAERFEPNPEPSRCKFCPVSMACDFSVASA